MPPGLHDLPGGDEVAEGVIDNVGGRAGGCRQPVVVERTQLQRPADNPLAGQAHVALDVEAAGSVRLVLIKGLAGGDQHIADVVRRPLWSYALEQAELQRVDLASEHADFNHWVEMSFVAVAVLVLGALTALRPAAFRLAASSAGTTMAVLGAASIVFSGYASATSQPWGWTALAGGLAFVGLAELEVRRLRRPAET